MATIGSNLEDSDGRQYKDVVGEDSSGNKYVLITNSSGQQEVVLVAGSARLGIALEDPHEVRVSMAIDASVLAYAPDDIVSDDDCCNPTASAWVFAGMANATGGYGEIVFASIISETENINPQLTLVLFNVTPTGNLTDNEANNNPTKADRAKWVGEIAFPALTNLNSCCASSSQMAVSTAAGKGPLRYKCAAGSTTLYGVLYTNTAFTQTPTDDIEIALQVRHL